MRAIEAAMGGDSAPLLRWLPLTLALLVCDVDGAAAQSLLEEVDGSGAYLEAGLGVVNIERGTGLRIPLGLTVLLSEYHVISSVALLDLGLFEGSNRDSRYQRSFRGCYDTESGFRVSDFSCSGGTDVIRSLSADISFIPADKIIVVGRPARLFTGMGIRLNHPRTPYGTIGVFFASRSQRANGARMSIGREFISLNMSWGLHLKGLANPL